MFRTGSLLILSCALAAAGCADQATNPVSDMSSGVAPTEALAFASTRGARWGSPVIYVANTDGSDVRRVTLGSEPAWSWSGQRIAFFREGNPYDQAGVYVADADGSKERWVSPGYSPAWSPTGRLAFGYAGGIAVTDVGAMSFERRLVDNAWAGENIDGCGPDGWPQAGHPAWSPDGTSIAFVLSCGEGSPSRVFLMNADGSQPRPLSEGTNESTPAWSPDGSMIAAWVDGAITTIDVNSGTHRTQYEWLDAGSGESLDWSPDGRQIVFTAWAPDKEERVYVLTLETGDVSQLIPDVWLSPGVMDYYRDFTIAWSRVGR